MCMWFLHRPRTYSPWPQRKKTVPDDNPLHLPQAHISRSKVYPSPEKRTACKLSSRYPTWKRSGYQNRSGEGQGTLRKCPPSPRFPFFFFILTLPYELYCPTGRRGGEERRKKGRNAEHWFLTGTQTDARIVIMHLRKGERQAAATSWWAWWWGIFPFVDGRLGIKFELFALSLWVYMYDMYAVLFLFDIDLKT